LINTDVARRLELNTIWVSARRAHIANLEGLAREEL